MFTPGLVVTSNSLRFLSVPIKTELKRFYLIPEIEMFSYSTPITARGSFQVACEKNWGSFEVGDRFGSCLGRFWGSFGVGDHFGSRTNRPSPRTSYMEILTVLIAYEAVFIYNSTFISLILNLIY